MYLNQLATDGFNWLSAVALHETCTLILQSSLLLAYNWKKNPKQQTEE